MSTIVTRSRSKRSAPEQQEEERPTTKAKAKAKANAVQDVIALGVCTTGYSNYSVSHHLRNSTVVLVPMSHEAEVDEYINNRRNCDFSADDTASGKFADWVHQFKRFDEWQGISFRVVRSVFLDVAMTSCSNIGLTISRDQNEW